MYRNTCFSALRRENESLPAPALCGRLIAISILICSAGFGQTQGLSITNYQLVSQQTIQRILNVTYRADIVNTGAALQAVTATVTSLNTSIVQVVAGQDTLQFPSVPANSQVTSSNTITLQLENSLPVDFSQLQWTLQTAAILIPGSVSVTPGATVNFPVTLGTPAPAGGVSLTLSSSNPSIANLSPSSFSVSQGSTTASRVVTTLTGYSAGSVTVTASAPGYATASSQVQVTSGGSTPTTMSFWPGSLTVNDGATQNLTLNLSVPAAATLTVNLSSSDPTVVTVPATVSFGTGSASVSVPVTGVGAGLVTITASAPNIASATASVSAAPSGSAPGGIILPANLTVAAGGTVNLPVALGTAAPEGGVSITLASGNPSIASAWPASIYIPQGAVSARASTIVSGISGGSTTITASAPGYSTASSQVQVTGGVTATTMSFSPASMTINGSATQNLTLNLSTPATAALTVNLSTSNATVATVPVLVSVATGANSVSVPVTGVSAGSVTITASALNFGSAIASVSVAQAAAGGILLPVNVTLMSGGTASFPVTLGTPAPAGGVSITLASANPSIATAWPASIYIPQGATSARASTILSGISAGSTTITASAFGYPTASSQVQVTASVTPTTMSFSPASLTINGSATQNLTLNLSTPAAATLTVNLSSTNAAVATVPAVVSVAAGAASVSVPVTGVSAGSVTITASAMNIASATAGVTVTQTTTGGTILVQPVTVGLNQSAQFPVTLPAPAPAGGVTVSLVSSNTSTATVPQSVFIVAGKSWPATQPQVSGLSVGSANITASAPGFTAGSATVQVTAGGGSGYFSPVTGLTINAGATQNLTLNLSSAPGGGVMSSLSSSNPSVATVPATVTFAAGSAAVNVPVTGVAPGSVAITASTPGFGTASTIVTVASLNGTSVTWNGACWATLTINGFTGNFQAMDFTLAAPAPVVVNGSLFFTPNCTGGADNMNDTGALTGSGTTIEGFIHYPNLIPSSALYWIGSASTDGTTCPAGSLCSGCVTYTQATPNCSALP